MTGSPLEPRSRTRQRILTALRRASLTANELAARLGLTHNAVRTHLALLQREGMVRERSLQRSGGRPAVVYEIAPSADALFSRAYVPFVAQLMRVLQERLRQDELDDLMHTVGRRLAGSWRPLRGDLPTRLKAASALLEELGALNDVEEADDGYVIRGTACLLSAAVHGRSEVCRSVETLLAELLEVSVHECCERGERPRCCFEIAARPTAH
jgi:predicted ArsR family transcriptional regulator